MMAPHTTLGKRGHELASGPNIRDKISAILGDQYDPDTNPHGFVNLGVSENVQLPTSSILSAWVLGVCSLIRHQFAMLPEVTAFVNSKVSQ